MENRWGVSKGFNNCELFSVVSLLPQKAVTLLLFFGGGLWLCTKWHGSGGREPQLHPLIRKDGPVGKISTWPAVNPKVFFEGAFGMSNTVT